MNLETIKIKVMNLNSSIHELADLNQIFYSPIDQKYAELFLI